MTVQDTTDEQETPRPGTPGDGTPLGWRLGLAAVVVVVALASFGIGLFTGRAGAGPTWPTTDSAEAGFARDMQTHHAQAVDMSMIVRDATDDAPTRQLAYDIALTQEQQIGQMYAWLVQWDLPQATTGDPMAWMHQGAGHEGMHGMEGMDGASMQGMPGMASDADMARLRQASGQDAEVLFLQLMIAHHRGGVAMAQGVLDRSQDEDVRRLAQAMVNGQNAEITLMESMLAERGALT